MASTSNSRLPDSPRNILFVGAGAIGCFYASRLHHPAHSINVSLVCRSNYPTIAKSGIHLKTHSFGDYHFSAQHVFKSISDAASSSKTPCDGWDYIFVTTKALPEITDDAKDIEPLMRKRANGKTCIVLIQNGVGIEEPHRRRFPNAPIISAVTIASVEQIQHGVIKQNKWTRISMGPFLHGGLETVDAHGLLESGASHVEELVAIFTALGGLRDAEAYDEIKLQQVRWHKICINAAMNPSAVLSGGLGSAEMAMVPEIREHVEGVMQEVFDAVPTILGEAFPKALASPELILKSTERNKGGKPSMLLDWEAGRPMELEVILGNPLKIAKRHGVEMPRMQTLYALLRSAQEQRALHRKRRERSAKI